MPPPERRAIHKEYKDLFDKDPLLLEEDSQRTYCKLLVNNILGNRTIVTSRPEHLRLDDESSLQKFKRALLAPPQPPSEALTREYRDAFIKRKKVPKATFEKLKNMTMVSDGELTMNRLKDEKTNRAAFADHDVAAKALGKVIDGRVRIAAVGHRVRISRLVNQAFFGEELCFLAPFVDGPLSQEMHEKAGIHQLGRTCLSPDTNTGSWCDVVVGRVRQALRRGAHIIVLPEFALPSADTSQANAIESLLSDESRGKPNHFLFAGSRHEGSYNRGLIIQAIDGDVKQGWHYKSASARTLGENILGPHSNIIASYPATLKIGDANAEVAIVPALCYDAFDPSTFLTLVNQARKLRKERWVQFIIVPSFNPSEDFVALLRDLSFLTRSVVLYVNSLHGDAKLFIAGFDVAELMDKAAAIQERVPSLLEELERELATAQNSITRQNLDDPKSAEAYKQAYERVQCLDDQVDALQQFSAVLPRLIASQSFEHLITIESCPICDAKGHHDLASCSRDTIYYNIDRALIRALARFRSMFINEAFLPEAFRQMP